MAALVAVINNENPLHKMHGKTDLPALASEIPDLCCLQGIIFKQAVFEPDKNTLLLRVVFT
jgi:hypothetical protein